MKMKLMNSLLGVALAAGAMTSACTVSDEAHLTVIYTTDLHGAILPFDFAKNKPAHSSLANVSTYIKSQREANPDGVIVLDAGDFLQGQPSIYYSNFVDTTSEHIQARVMEYVGYDAAAVGNHDIEPGAGVYDRVQKDFSFPWLAANALDERTGEPYFEPYTIIERKGVKIAVLGMITPNIHSWLPKYLWKHIRFEDMVETAQKWVPIIEEKENPDLLIGLFHSGHNPEANNSTMDTYKNENGAIPAVMKVDGFDMVLLGHDHQEVAEVIINDFGNEVVVMDALSSARVVGQAQIVMEKEQGTWRKKSITPELVSMKDYVADPEFTAQFSDFVAEVNTYVDLPMGVLLDTLKSNDALYGPSEFMDLIHNAQLEAMDADVSFAGVLSTNAVIPAGELTMRNLFSLYKYENLLYAMSLTGAEIDQFLEYGYGKQYNQMKSTSDHLLNYKKNEAGELIKDPRYGYTFETPSFNFTSAAGIKYVVDVTKEPGERVTILSMSDGGKFDPAKRYTVAVNSYQASGGGGFFADGLGWSKEQTDDRVLIASEYDVRKYIADYIKQKKEISGKGRGDWKVIPEAYFDQGMAKDVKMMQSK